MRDVIKEIAESDPYIFIDHRYEILGCYYCGAELKDIYPEDYVDKGGEIKQECDHAPDCLWVWCRERLQQRTGEEPV